MKKTNIVEANEYKGNPDLSSFNIIMLIDGRKIPDSAEEAEDSMAVEVFVIEKTPEED